MYKHVHIDQDDYLHAGVIVWDKLCTKFQQTFSVFGSNYIIQVLFVFLYLIKTAKYADSYLFKDKKYQHID